VAHTPYTADDIPDDDLRECNALVRVEDGEFTTVAPPETPWLCWDLPAEEWTEPEPTAFED
jgi:hypothetical protein